MFRMHLASLALLFGSACAATSATVAPREKATPELAYRLASDIAASASALNVGAIMRLIPHTDRVVYVSNGHPITGTEYREVMGNFYGTLKRLDWKWDKWEALAISDDSIVFTGWATVVAVRRDGEQQVERAIHTMLFVRQQDGWKRVISHKTKLPIDEEP